MMKDVSFLKANNFHLLSFYAGEKLLEIEALGGTIRQKWIRLPRMTYELEIKFS